jgi:sec-independent protein translocase protein TatA
MRLGFGESPIVLVIAVLVFGPAKLPQLGDALGKGIRNFRNASSGADDRDGGHFGILGTDKARRPEHLEARRAFRATLMNFAARLLVALTFVAIAALLPPRGAVVGAIAWGAGLLVGSAATSGSASRRESDDHPAVVSAGAGASRPEP